MQLFSQHDPDFDRQRIGASTLTIHGYGCFLTSLGSLFQRHPLDIMKIPGAITPDGLVVASTIAQGCGGTYTGQSQSGTGWQIAQTDHYAAQGYPTHFFCVNQQLQQQIDPLKFPAIVEPLKYKIVNVRVFTGQKLDSTQLPAFGVFPDVPVDDPAALEITWAKEQGLMKGREDGKFYPNEPVTRRQLAVVLYRALHK